ncbi:MAG: type II secretory pathway predicted ATPase ExeA/cytoskeletal protein CcmA (bactofilin family) [Desulforhopalus sp.]|jgi:type II secretory pathway predicted ATPase ExeA/cytoskeletal protein CcmA (bactofilin family)
MKENTSKIDKSMKVVGDIVSDGDLILDGELQGSFIGRNLVVNESGRIIGEVKGENIDCAGHLEGRVVTKSLKLKKGGCQVGTVMTVELEVELGAVMDCALQSGAVQQIFSPPDERVPKEVKKVNLSQYLDAFKETRRPCCFDVPWSERLELYTHLGDLLQKNKPLIKVVGDSGSGKTVLVRKLLADSFEKYVILELEEKVGSVTTLLKEVAIKLGIAGHNKHTGQGQLLLEIRRELVARNGIGERVVLLIDEGQEMFQATMEGVIRLLCGACVEEEINGEEYLQIILFGTSAMKANMVATILDYFADETNCQLSLDPLNMKDTADYLRLGLQLASNGDEQTAMSLLPNESIKEIHARSKGSIATVNFMMDKALELARDRGENSLSPELVRKVLCQL